jgi:hypothetical protein
LLLTLANIKTEWGTLFHCKLSVNTSLSSFGKRAVPVSLATTLKLLYVVVHTAGNIRLTGGAIVVISKDIVLIDVVISVIIVPPESLWHHIRLRLDTNWKSNVIDVIFQRGLPALLLSS